MRLGVAAIADVDFRQFPRQIGRMSGIRATSRRLQSTDEMTEATLGATLTRPPGRTARVGTNACVREDGTPQGRPLRGRFFDTARIGVVQDRHAPCGQTLRSAVAGARGLMDMTEASPDTLTTARRLEHEFGMERRASEGVAIAIHEHTTANLASKADLRRVEGKVRGEIKELGATLRGEMNELGATLRGEMNESGATLRGEMNELGTTLRGEMNELGTSLRGEIKTLDASLRGHTDSSIADLRADMQSEFKSLYRHLWLMLAGFAGLIVALNKLLP